MVNFRFDPCLQCCGGCPVCKDRLTPAQIQVEISGISDAGCANCEALNATFILPLAGEVGGDSASSPVNAHCLWMSLAMFGGSASEPEPWACDQDPWQRITSAWFTITLLDDLTYDLQFWLQSDFDWPHYGPWITYGTNVGLRAPDCLRFDALELSYRSSYTGPGVFHALECDVASSTCTITALRPQSTL
jgi:hypothetical protein